PPHPAHTPRGVSASWPRSTCNSTHTLPSSMFFFSTLRPPPRPTLFPYTTLFRSQSVGRCPFGSVGVEQQPPAVLGRLGERARELDRKSTRLNSSHVSISYAVFCLKKKKGAISSVTEPATRLAPSANLGAVYCHAI